MDKVKKELPPKFSRLLEQPSRYIAVGMIVLPWLWLALTILLIWLVDIGGETASLDRFLLWAPYYFDKYLLWGLLGTLPSTLWGIILFRFPLSTAARMVAAVILLPTLWGYALSFVFLAIFL